jgi:hypothetical protein
MADKLYHWMPQPYFPGGASPMFAVPPQPGGSTESWMKQRWLMLVNGSETTLADSRHRERF